MTTRTRWKAEFTKLVAAHNDLRDKHAALSAKYNTLLALQTPPQVPVSLLTLDAKRALMRATREEAMRTGRCIKVTA